MLLLRRYYMKKDDIVFYEEGRVPYVGKLGGRWQNDSWYVIPLEPFKNVAKRKEKFLRPINDFKKFLTNTK